MSVITPIVGIFTVQVTGRSVVTVSNAKAVEGMKNSRKSASEVAEFRTHVGTCTRYTDPSLFLIYSFVLFAATKHSMLSAACIRDYDAYFLLAGRENL